MQPVGADGQIRRPEDSAITGLTLGDNLNSRNDFPAQRERRDRADLGSRGLPRPHHDSLIQKPVGNAHRQGIQDDSQRGWSVTWR